MDFKKWDREVRRMEEEIQSEKTALKVFGVIVAAIVAAVAIVLLAGCTMPTAEQQAFQGNQIGEINQTLKKIEISVEKGSAALVQSAEYEGASLTPEQRAKADTSGDKRIAELEAMIKGIADAPNSPDGGQNTEWIGTLLSILAAVTGLTFLGTSGTRTAVSKIAGALISAFTQQQKPEKK